SGLYLALITLMLAGAITVALSATNFPNGGGGFLGHTESSFGNAAVRRPAIAGSDPGYFRYTVIVAAVMFVIALLHVRAKPGRSCGVRGARWTVRSRGGAREGLRTAPAGLTARAPAGLGGRGRRVAGLRGRRRLAAGGGAR